MNREGRRWDMPWYDWLVFAVPAVLVFTLGLESALGPVLHPGEPEPRDFRAVAHWFDPVFFQYNLAMTLLAVLVVPSPRRSLCPRGYSITTSPSLLPSWNSTVMPLAMERLSGS